MVGLMAGAKGVSALRSTHFWLDFGRQRRGLTGYTRGMASSVFYRNVRARDHLELFLLAAASSLLGVRLYLHLTGYPQISTGGLHIAHMLWGGLLMLAALILALSFLGARVQRVMALVGGAGFGVFIDELGKFITNDNNYFYRPTVGLIYAVFIILYLAFNFLSRDQALSSREYQLNALAQLEEAVVRDMDATEKARVQTLLARADADDPLTKQMQKIVAGIQELPPAKPTRPVRLIRQLDKKYEEFWKRQGSSAWVRSFFVIEVLVFVAGAVGTAYLNLGSVFAVFAPDVVPAAWLTAGQLLSALIAAGFVSWGVILLPRSRLKAYEQFRRATLVNIFLVQFFVFSRLEFAALPGFLFNILLLGLINYAIRQEQRLRALKS